MVGRAEEQNLAGGLEGTKKRGSIDNRIYKGDSKRSWIKHTVLC